MSPDGERETSRPRYDRDRDEGRYDRRDDRRRDSGDRDREIEPPRDESEDANDTGTNLFVTGLARSIDQQRLREIFEKYGPVDKTSIMTDPHTRDSRGFGFVSMVDPAHAEAAKAELSGTEIDGRTLTIEKARRKRPRTPTPGRYFGPPKARKPYPFRPNFRDRYYERPRYEDRRYEDYRKPRYEDRPSYRGGYNSYGGDRYEDRERYPPRDYRDRNDRYERRPPRPQREERPSFRDDREGYPPAESGSNRYREREERDRDYR